MEAKADDWTGQAKVKSVSMSMLMSMAERRVTVDLYLNLGKKEEKDIRRAERRVDSTHSL